MLSVSGMRGLVGRSITPTVVARYAAAFGSWLKQSRNTAHPAVVLGRDSRPSGEMFENAAAAGLVSVGCKVVRVGILSTPGVAIMGTHLSGGADGGMVITGAADRLGHPRIRRLVYWNAFVPMNGEALNDLVPPAYVELFGELTAADGSVALPWPIWRDAFINDADEALARSAYERLNPHPAATFSEPITLSCAPAELAPPKSYVNCTDDTALPHSLGWHPRLSERLGLFRLVQLPGSHELCFTDPARLAAAFVVAGRD